MKNKKIENQKSKKGFSLVEVMVAIFVFSIIMVMVSGAFASFLKNYAQTKKNQRNVENAQYAMNIMAKTIRTSKVLSDRYSTTLQIFDYSQGTQGKCIEYNFDSVGKKITTKNFDPAIPGDPDECKFDLADFSDMTPAIIEHMYVQAISSGDAGYEYGKVTISLEVEDPTQSSLNFPIQMTVSLRQ